MSKLAGRSVDGDNLHSHAVSRAYRAAAREEPSAALDQAIQAAALRAVGSRPGRTLRRWGVPVAVVATIVIGVSVAFLATERDHVVLAPLADTPTSRAQETRDDAVVPRAKVEALKKDGTVPEPQAAPTSATKSVPGGGEREARPSRERTARGDSGTKRDPRSQAPAETGSAALRTDPGEGKATPNTAPRADLLANQDAAFQSPELWLQRIRELRARGEPSQAEESLRAFRRRYPDYPLPADLSPSAEGAK